MVLWAIAPNLKDFFYIYYKRIRSVTWGKCNFFFQLVSTSRFQQCWWKMVLTVEGGRSNCATTYFCRIFPIQFEHIFCGQLVAGEWWWWCLKNKLGIKQVFFKVLLYVCMYILIVSHFGVRLWPFLVDLYCN